MSLSGRTHFVVNKSLISCFSVSLAHRYWDDDLSMEENHRLFGSSASPVGLGANLDIEVETSGPGASIKDQIKSAMDHKSFLQPTQSLKVSSLENLCHMVVAQFGSQMHSLRMRESRQLECYWENSRPQELELTWTRPFSLTFRRQDGGISGRRLNLDFTHSGHFSPAHGILIPRSFFESELESKMESLEKDGWQVQGSVNSDSFNSDEQILDALFNEIKGLSFRTKRLKMEIEYQKKWLIRP